MSTPAKDSPATPTSASYNAFGSLTPYAEPLWYSRNVTPHYTDSHRKLRAAVRQYIDDEILPHAFEWETAGKVPDSARDINFFDGGSANKLQAFKRHAELGYLALSTGLSNVTLPGNVPFAEWDSWHTLILTDEISRVVWHDASHIRHH